MTCRLQYLLLGQSQIAPWIGYFFDATLLALNSCDYSYYASIEEWAWRIAFICNTPYVILLITSLCYVPIFNNGFLLVDYRSFVFTFVLPGSYVREVFIITCGFTYFGLRF